MRWALAALRPIGALLAPLGVEPRALREVVAVRMRVADRARRERMGAGEVLGMIMLAGLGLGLGWLARDLESPFLWSALVLGALAILAFFVLLQEGAAILFDPTDAAVVAPLPVGSRTLFASRLVVVGSALLVPVGLPVATSALVAATVHGPVAALLLHPLLAAVSCLGVLGVFASVYGLLLRVLGPARIQRFVTVAQVLGGAVVYGLLLLGMRGSARPVAESLLEQPLLALAFPPANLAALYGAALGDTVPALGGHATLALLVPLALGSCALLLVSREFQRALLGRVESATQRRAAWPDGALARLNQRVNPKGAARAGFGLATAMTRRDTAFVRAGYGTLAMNFVLIAFIVFKDSGGSAFPLRFGTAFAMYVLAGQLPALFFLASFGPERDALLPLRGLDEPGVRRYQAGALRGIAVGTAVPVLLGFTGLLTLLQGPAALPDALLASAIALVMLLLFARRLKLPPLFTRGPMRRQGTTSRLGMTLGFLLSIPAGLLLHAPFLLHPLAPLVGIPLFAALFLRLLRSLDGVELERRRHSKSLV